MKYIQLLKKRNWDSAIVFLLAGAIGAIIFLLFFGVGVVNPMNDTWIKANDSDMSQHYIGWIFFRQSDWTFPIGIIKNLAYPHGLGITFMDSIPLFAIPFKLFSFALPATFQYFGIWGLFSYILQGGLAALIVRHLTKKNVFAVIASILFTLSPIVLDRMFSHTALAGHWIVLAALLVLICTNRQTSNRQFIVRWTLVMALSACIHPYFIPMNAALLAISAVLTYRGAWWWLILRGAIPLGIMMVVFWLIGGLSMGGSVGADQLGVFSFNLNSLFNSMGFSRFFVTLPGSPGDYEGFAYLGLGGLVLLALTFYIFVAWVNKQNIRLIQKYLRHISWRQVVATLIVVGLLIAAISPVIHFGAHVLVIHIPHKVEAAWSIFRSTGRLFWPIYYLLMTGLIFVVFKNLHKKATHIGLIAFFAAIVTLQALDIFGSARAIAKHDKFAHSTARTYTSNLNVVTWTNALQGKHHIQYLGDASGVRFFDVAYIAAAHHVTLSDGYFARSPKAKIAETKEAARKALLNGDARDDTLYVSDDQAVNTVAENSGSLQSSQDQGILLIERR